MNRVTQPRQDVSVSVPQWHAFSTFAFREKILRLDHGQRLVCCLVHFERLSIGEVATVLEWSETKVAMLFYQAHVALGLIPDSVSTGAPQ